MITLKRFKLLEEAIRVQGYSETIDWSETIAPPENAKAFAEQAIYVICNSGMRVSVAEPIFRRCMEALNSGGSVITVFGHPGKNLAIDHIWQNRQSLFEQFNAAEEPIAFLETLPWIGPITRHHLAKNLGANEAKPDVHMERLARREQTTTAELCVRLSAETGYRAATIDTILWRACADMILDSRRYELEGWDAAFRGPGSNVPSALT